MGMGHPALGIISLVVAGAFLIWVYEKSGNPAQKIGKLIGWFGVIVATLLLIGQMAMCVKMCRTGQCMRMMHGEGMMPPMMHEMPMMPDEKK